VRADPATIAPGDLDDVGEVVLALGVVVGDPGDRVGEETSVEREDAAADLPDGGLLGGGVPLLDDRGDRRVGVAQDAAVAEGVRDLGGEHGERPARVGEVVGDQPGQRLALQQGRVPRHHDDDAIRRTGRGGERVQGDAYGVSGALLLLLDREQRSRHLVEDVRPDQLAGVPDNGHEVLGLDVQGRGQHVTDHAPAADGVQHLHQLRPHPGAAPGGEHDHRHRVLGLVGFAHAVS